MKKSGFFILVVIMLFAVPIFVKAEKNDGKFDSKNAILLGEEQKYLKTVNVYENVIKDENGNIVSADLLTSDTSEITKEDWEKAKDAEKIITRSTTTIETSYKLMTTSLYYNNGTYRYKNQLNWLSFPSVRAFDVIGIGHYNNITPSSTPTCYVEYVTASGAHYTNTWCYKKSFSSGESGTFPLPAQNLQSLSIMFYFDAAKVNPNGTIYSQCAYGDYAHGINSSVTLSDATNHVVNGSLGIVHDSSVYFKFDTINEGVVFWNGTW